MRALAGVILVPAALVAACAGGAPAPQFVTTRPVPETIDCLATALDSAGYKVIRSDRRRGQLEARRDSDAPAYRTDLREYKRGDRLEVDAAEDRKTWTVKPSGYRELRSSVGPETEIIGATDAAAADAAFLQKRCIGS